ncbi:MAG TPA: hypothetical protein VF161_09950 [Steroidobacteraceae bacterium]|jgi:hypothetical protein
MNEFFQQYLSAIVVLIAVAIALTVVVFRKRLFERGYRKGKAADPEQVKRDNPPDEWTASH